MSTMGLLGDLGDNRSKEGNCEQLESRAKQPVRGWEAGGNKTEGEQKE